MKQPAARVTRNNWGDEELCVPATVQQQGVWFHAAGHDAAYWNLVHYKRFRGIANITALRKALTMVIQRHAALRTNFVLRDNRLYQVIKSAVACDTIFACHDGNELPGITAAIDAEVKLLRNREFDLAHEPLFRFSVIHARDEYCFILTINHIITDGISQLIFWNELAGFYNNYCKNDFVEPVMPARQYSHFSAEQEHFFSTDSYRQQQAYWNARLPAAMPVLPLPFFTDPSKAGMAVLRFDVPDQLTNAVRSFSLKHRVIHSSVFLLAYFLLLYKYTGQSAIAIGNIINGRGFGGKRKNSDSMGLFASRLMQLLTLTGEASLLSLLKQVHEDCVHAFRHSDIPFEAVIREHNNRHRSGTAPFYQAAFDMIKNVDQPVLFDGLCQAHDTGREEAVFFDTGARYPHDICLYVFDNIKSVRLQMEYRCDPSLRALAPLLKESYLHILHGCVSFPQKELAQIGLLTHSETGFITGFNQTHEQFMGERLVHELFRTQAQKDPQRIALQFKQETITYAQLDLYSDQLAAGLQKAGARANTIVGIYLKRSPWIVISMLAILKTGAAYLPLDPGFPAARLSYMTGSSGAIFILTEKALQPSVAAGTHTLLVEDVFTEHAGAVIENNHQPGNLAYVIYTSGSTGTPKGVMVHHGAVVNFIRGMTRAIPFSGQKIFSLTTVSFDIFVLESLLAVCAAATVVIGNEEEQQDPIKATDTIMAAGIDMLQCTPSRLKMLLDAGRKSFLQGLSFLLVGGEALPADLLRKIQQRFRGRIFNLYGPTETTVWSCIKELTEDSRVAIGKPIANTKVYILNAHLQVQGIGIYGEIGIAGAGLSPGYLGDDKLTTQKFIYTDAVPGERVYLTGDTGRWLPGGDLEITGRKDDQVKIRGYRVELAEIEFNLKQYPGIKDAVVLCRHTGGYDDLLAWYTSHDQIDPRLLRNFLLTLLPGYMVPSFFIPVDAFPLTPNNKTDRKALQEQQMDLHAGIAIQDDGVNPKLSALWSRHLQATGSSNMFTSFFDLGGHSIKALHLLKNIEEQWGVKIPVREFFQFPTLHFLNQQLQSSFVNH